MLRLLCIAMLAFALSSTPALAATVSILGPGSNPRVAVDGAGNGHFTWSDIQPSGGDVFHYCRVARGAGACAASATRNNGEQNLSGGYAFPVGGSRVLALEARCCAVNAQKYLYTSADGGASFDAGVSPGFENDTGANIAGQALYAPAGTLGALPETLLTISDLQSIGLSFQATGTTANPAFNSEFLMSSGNSYNGSLAQQGTTVVAAWSTLGPENVHWRAWNGGDINTSAGWTPEALVGPTNLDSNTRLASGPGGIYISYSVGPPGQSAFEVRRFTGGGFGPPITLSEVGSPNFGDLFEDPSGRLHFAWEDSSGNLRYRYATDAQNTVFSTPQTLSAQHPDGNFAGLRLASDSAGRGFVTWNFYSSALGVKSVPFAPGEQAPVLGRTVGVAPVKGSVLVSVPPGASAAGSVPGIKGRNFVALTQARQIPVRSLLDTRKGTVRLTSARDTKGKTQSGDFTAGVFQVLQSRKKRAKGLTELGLKGSSFKRCGSGGKRSRARSSAGRTIRRLRANAKGRFRTRGRHSAATVRGTIWITTDRCDGTLTKVTRGKVAVRDFRRKRTITLRRGKSYLAKARR